MFKASTAMTRNPVAVSRDTCVYEAISLMVENEVAGLPVVDADGTVAGIISEKDVLKLLYQLEDGDATVEHFMTEDVVTFEVDRRASKPEIKAAVEKLFKVKVSDIRTMMMAGKYIRLGRSAGKRPNWKKALVKLAEGSNIEFYENR